MSTRMSFATRCAVGCPTHAELALALAGEFHEVPSRAVEHELGALAAPVLGALHGARLDALAAICAHVADELEPATSLSSLDDLLLDRVLFNRVGHPLALAVACVEAGRRCGVRLGVVAGPGGCFVAHCDEDAPVLADPAEGGLLLDAADVPGRIGWCCSHQVAGRMLNEVLERADRTQHPAWALQATGLRLALPYDVETRRRLETDHAYARARMN